ncbi:hypothetical protein ACFLW8_04515 [Chloroflexota bacterium]
MKSVQVRLNGNNYEGLERIAKDESTTVANVMRNAILLYAVAHSYKKEGRKLVWESTSDSTDRAELVIPSITV